MSVFSQLRELLHPAYESIELKRLGHDMHAWVQMTVVQHRVFGVPSDEQDLQA
jgi:hypothetical protein